MRFFQRISTWTANISFLAVNLAAFAMAFPRKWMNIFFVAFMISWGVEILLRGKYSFEKPNKKNIHLYLLWTYFAWMLISFLWSSNIPRAEEQIIKRIAFFAIPLLAFFGMGKDIHYKKVLLSFVIGTFSSVIVGLSISLYLFKTNNNTTLYEYFIYYQDYVHHTYFGLCKIFSLIILIYLKPEIIRKLRNTSIYYVVIGILSVIYCSLIYLSEARMPLIIFVVILISNITYLFWKRKYYKTMILGTLFLLIIGGIIIKSQPRMRNFEFSREKLQQFDPRYDLWRNGYQCVKNNNKVIGVGIGDYTDIFEENHKKPDFKEHFFNADSCHNHYIDLQLELGMIGLVIFLGLMSLCFVGAKESRNKLFIYNFLLVWSLFFMIENLSLRTYPIYMFCFSLLFIYWIKKYEQNKELAQ